jgi:hypothetical protein
LCHSFLKKPQRISKTHLNPANTQFLLQVPWDPFPDPHQYRYSADEYHFALTKATMSTEHPADEAGGEAIFSSDGLAPLPVVSPPVFTSVTSVADGETILDTGDIHPSEAFEVFRGKVYPPSRTVKTFLSTDETPLQRLARLQKETEEWIRDFDASHYDGGEDEIHDTVQVATALRDRLQQASSQVPQKQLELSQVVHTKLQQIGTLMAATTDVPAECATTTSLSLPPPSAALEQRLIRLEQLLGSTVEDKPLLQRLELLERGVSRLDPKTLEDAATKAKVIRADLEAASKAKTKLALPGRKEDTKTIVSLHDQMVELQGLSSHLPALVNRLQQLATLHGQAAMFASRLGETEKEVVHIGNICTKLEETLSRVEVGMTDNLTKMEANVKLLDERLQNLS